MFLFVEAKSTDKSINLNAIPKTNLNHTFVAFYFNNSSK